MLDIEKELTGFSEKSYKYIQDRVREKLKENDTIDIVLKDGTTIKNIKSIETWAQGIFYSHKIEPDEYNKSFSAFQLKEIRGKDNDR